MIHGKHRQFYPVRNTKLVENSSQVMFNGVLTDMEGLGNILIDLTFNNGRDDFEFTTRETHGFAISSARFI